MWKADMGRWQRRIGWVMAFGAGIFLPVALQAGDTAILEDVTHGAWELRNRENGSRQRICLRTGWELVQLRHRQPDCSRYVIRDDAPVTIVHYTCPGNGYGRTTIRRETKGLLQVESQGIHKERPFSITAEATHVGSC